MIYRTRTAALYRQARVPVHFCVVFCCHPVAKKKNSDVTAAYSYTKDRKYGEKQKFIEIETTSINLLLNSPYRHTSIVLCRTLRCRFVAFEVDPSRPRLTFLPRERPHKYS